MLAIIGGSGLTTLSSLDVSHREVVRTPYGEIDLVAKRGDLVVFVEVKQRSRTVDALAALQPRQQARIARAAAAYLQRRPQLAHCATRFDLVTIAPWRLPRHVRDVWRA